MPNSTEDIRDLTHYVVECSEEDAFNVNASHEIASVQTITDSRIIGDDGSISINDSDNRSHKSSSNSSSSRCHTTSLKYRSGFQIDCSISCSSNSTLEPSGGESDPEE